MDDGAACAAHLLGNQRPQLRIPITTDGVGVIFASTLVLLLVAAVAFWFTPWAIVPCAIVWAWVLSFFRDPARHIERQTEILYAPADGTITEVVELENHDLIGGPCVRVRIFLSLFNAHINRMPCAARVKAIRHKPGRYLNAMRAQSAVENESNTLVIAPASPWAGPIVVRQIAGMVARTIVCHAKLGDEFESGQRFGMIKFGSGTELIVPKQEGLEVLAKPGAQVKAGLTAMMSLEKKASAKTPQSPQADRSLAECSAGHSID